MGYKIKVLCHVLISEVAYNLCWANNIRHFLFLIQANPDPDCGNHMMDCGTAGAGTHPDPFNCRKYWNCDAAGTGYHFFCPGGQVPGWHHSQLTVTQLFSMAYLGCDWEDRVDCGQRPVCDNCDENCYPH